MGETLYGISPTKGYSVFVPVVPTVFLLGLYCDPTAIFRTVSFVVVDAVNGQIVSVTVRHGPIVKDLKVIKPFSADGNTSAAVVVVLLKILVVAAGFHPSPNAV